MNSFIKFILGLAASVGSIILKGYVISTLWLWFVVAIFHVAPISIPQGIGLGLLSLILTLKTTNRNDAERSDAIEYGFMLSYLASLVILSLGFVVKQFM